MLTDTEWRGVGCLQMLIVVRLQGYGQTTHQHTFPSAYTLQYRMIN